MSKQRRVIVFSMLSDAARLLRRLEHKMFNRLTSYRCDTYGALEP